MSIFEIIEEESPDLDEYLWEELYRQGGVDIVARGLVVLDSEDSVRKWFYQDNYALGGRSPYELCLQDDHDEVVNLLYRIEYGIPV
jgi:uncharacterized protein (DUF2384 family)